REATGLELRVGSLGGNWWNSLELGDVEIAGGAPKTELVSLRIVRATARFDLFGLVRGDLDAIHSIELESGSVAVDIDAPHRKTPKQRPWEFSPKAFP